MKIKSFISMLLILFIVVITGCDAVITNNTITPTVKTSPSHTTEPLQSEIEKSEYGNKIYASFQSHRLAVEDYSGGFFICKNIQYKYSTSKPNDVLEVYHVDKEGNERYVFKALIGQLSYYDGWIYYSDWNYGNNSYFYSMNLYRIRPNGENLQHIYNSIDRDDGYFDGFQIFDGIIYYNTSYTIFTTDLMGEQKTIIYDNDSIKHIQIVDNKIFFLSENKVFTLDLNGKNGRLIIEDKDLVRIFIDEKNIYLFKKTQIDYCDLNGQNYKVLITQIDGWPESLFVYKRTLFFYYIRNGGGFSCNMEMLDLENNERLILCEDIVRSKYAHIDPILIKDRIYYHSDSESIIYSISLRGEEKRVWFEQ